MLQDNPKDAVKYGEAAVAANPNYSGGHYALSAAYVGLAKLYSDPANREQVSMRAKLMTASQQSNLTAGKLDKPNLEGREVPDAKAAFRYFETGGRTLVMSSPK